MPSSIADEHRAAGPTRLRCAVVTISDTRTRHTDRGGPLLATALMAAGHHVVGRHLVPDEPAAIESLLRDDLLPEDPDAILMTGGTGITARDQTYETLRELLTRELPGYGELFRFLSYQQIGPAAMLSRALGGLIGQTIVLTMPGSPNAIQLALQELILPELPHLVQQARS